MQDTGSTDKQAFYLLNVSVSGYRASPAVMFKDQTW